MGSAIIAVLRADIFWYYVGGYCGGRVLKLLCPLDGSIEREAQRQFPMRNFGGRHRMIQQRACGIAINPGLAVVMHQLNGPNELFLIRRSD
jgi:hypothetical protein